MNIYILYIYTYIYICIYMYIPAHIQEHRDRKSGAAQQSAKQALIEAGSHAHLVGPPGRRWTTP